MAKKKGEHLYIITFISEQPDDREFDGITLGEFDTDEEAIAFAKKTYTAGEGSYVARVVNKAIAVWEK